MSYIEPPASHDSIFDLGARKRFRNFIAAVEASKGLWRKEVRWMNSRISLVEDYREIYEALSYIPAELYETLWEWKRGSEEEILLSYILSQSPKTSPALLTKISGEAAKVESRAVACLRLYQIYREFSDLSLASSFYLN